MTGAIIAVPVDPMATGTTGIAVSRFRRPRRRAGATAPASPAAVTAGVVAPFAAPASTRHAPDNIAACEREP